MIAVVRVRGTVNVRRDVEETLRRLRLTKPNHCIVLPETDAYLGMVNKVKDWVAYGEIDLETLKLLLKERGKVIGGKPLTDEICRKIGFDDIDDLAEALYSGQVGFSDLGIVKPVFRLHPPSKGYHRNVKKHYPEGSLGYWGRDIRKLIERMV
ncbi:MAG: 50S ribosomal protein L30 [Nitrososphaerota archaeon]|nr:50S ribosomal protein L30 [Candidatus Bathyarchaeota archaeon]MDW8062493.1 50S ribosomal protein L30 [Nitrososphaerota archaeon]